MRRPDPDPRRVRYLAVLDRPTALEDLPRPTVGGRRLAWSSMHLTLLRSADELDAEVSAVLDEAETSGLPVLVQFDDWNFPPPRWAGDAARVEWTDWDGTLAEHRTVEWLDDPQPPPPNVASPLLWDELEPKLRRVFGLIAARLDVVAGVVVGWESGVYRSPSVRTGYAALTERGWPEHKVLDVVVEYVERWVDIAVEEGIPAARVYTHFAPGASLQDDGRVDGRDIPLDMAGRRCRAGFTMTPDWCDPRAVAASVQGLFGAPELEVTDVLRNADRLHRYLEWLTAAGAEVVCVWGWWHEPGHRFAVRGTAAEAGLARWLSGGAS